MYLDTVLKKFSLRLLLIVRSWLIAAFKSKHVGVGMLNSANVLARPTNDGMYLADDGRKPTRIRHGIWRS